MQRAARLGHKQTRPRKSITFFSGKPKATRVIPGGTSGTTPAQTGLGFITFFFVSPILTCDGKWYDKFTYRQSCVVST